jgi:glutamate 5-kinase
MATIGGMSGRSEYLSGVKSAVVKLGTQLLSDAGGNIDAPFVATIAKQVASLRSRGIRVTLVSSGAIGCGLKELKIPKRPTDLAILQAVAAVGQRRLMDVWAAAFLPHQTHIAQLLLTREDIDDRSRFLNLRNTIAAAHELGAIPIINENDTVSTAEIERISFGDNDILAALVANALRADLLALLTVVDGVLDSESKPIRLVNNLDEARKHLRPEKSPLGKGGMDSKLTAARMMTDAGEAMVVADGRMPDVLLHILDGKEIGTLFTPAGRKRSSRDRWISSLRTTGTITIDDGARKALQQNNRSLLPAGIVKVAGEFARGDAVAIVTSDGTLVARGLSNYSHHDMLLIKGKKTAEVRLALPDRAYDEAVHKDNLVLERLEKS